MLQSANRVGQASSKTSGREGGAPAGIRTSDTAIREDQEIEGKALRPYQGLTEQAYDQRYTASWRTLNPGPDRGKRRSWGVISINL